MDQRTLLEIVNDISVTLDFETVSDIDETPESERIVRLAKMVYQGLMANGDWPHLKTLTRLEALNDPERPTFLKIPNIIAEITSVRYEITDAGDEKRQFKEVEYFEHPSDFLDKVLHRDTSRDNVEILQNHEGVPIPVFNSQPPTYCTTFDDTYLVFDSYDINIDSTLQSHKSIVEGLRGYHWHNENTFVPEMPGRMFPVYMAKLSLVAGEKLRQTYSQEDAYDARVGISRLRRKSRVIPEKRKPRYGRRSR